MTIYLAGIVFFLLLNMSILWIEDPKFNLTISSRILLWIGSSLLWPATLALIVSIIFGKSK